MENTEFSSKLPGFSSPVLASVVEEGSSLLPEADALSEAGAALDAGLLSAEPLQAASRQPSKAAHSSSARGRIYFDVIRKTSVTGAPASAGAMRDLHSKYTFCARRCQSFCAGRISSRPVQDIQKCGLNFGQFNALTFSALARIIKSRQVNLSVRVTVRSGMSIRGKAATASLWFLCPFSFSQKLRHGSGGVRRCRL